MKILIVDDDDIALELLENALTGAGYEVITTTNPHEALELVRNDVVRFVISDWEMPELNGLDLCRTIRDSDTSGYVYLILLTSHDTSAELVEGMNAGADDFIAKPFHPEELIVRVRAGARLLSLETRDVAIFALAKLTESRDNETGQHLERVQHYSRALAQQLSLNPKFAGQIDGEFIRLIYLTSPLHDIGKVGIPDCVLLKPGRLDDAEFAIMKTHTTIGAETLAAAAAKYPEARFLQMAREIAATHHERFDGNGYPERLVGTQIPLSGRIVSVADVYDALTSKRVYKDAFTHTVARSMIVDGAGTQFDPDVVAAFLQIETQFTEIRTQFSDSGSLPSMTKAASASGKTERVAATVS